MMRRLLSDLLRQFHVGGIVSAATAQEAWETLQANPVDLLLVDWTPTLDGAALVRRIRTDPDSRDPFVAVIMVTAYADVPHICMARDFGMNEYLRKPVSAKILYARICSLIENDRIFVKSAAYVGPNRRRRSLPLPDGERRATEEVDLMDFEDRRHDPRDIDFPERRRGYPGYRADRRHDPRAAQAG